MTERWDRGDLELSRNLHAQNPLFHFLFSIYATVLITLVSESATSYPPSSHIPAGVEGANICLAILFFLISVVLLLIFGISKLFVKKMVGIRIGTILYPVLFLLGSWWVSNGYSTAFLIVMIGYASILAMIYEVYSGPLKSTDRPEALDELRKAERQDWWRTVQVTLTFSVAVVLGTGLSTYTDVFLAPKHILILIGLPAIGIVAVLLRGVQQMRRLKPDPN